MLLGQPHFLTYSLFLTTPKLKAQTTICFCFILFYNKLTFCCTVTFEYLFQIKRSKLVFVSFNTKNSNSGSQKRQYYNLMQFSNVQEPMAYFWHSFYKNRWIRLFVKNCILIYGILTKIGINSRITTFTNIL